MKVKMKKKFSVLYVLVAWLLGGCANSSPAYELDVQATQAAPWQVGQNVAQSTVPCLAGVNPSGFCHVYRLFLGVDMQGYYLVQDFYKLSDEQENGRVDVKLTDPYLLMSAKFVEDDNFGRRQRDERIYGGYFTLDNFGTRECGVYGRYASWYSNGKRFNEGLFENGKPQGLSTWWHTNGRAKRQEGLYEEGVKQGLWTRWDEHKYYEEEYVDGKRQGRWTAFNLNGRKIVEGQYQAGREPGLWTRYVTQQGTPPKGASRMNSDPVTESTEQGLWTWWHNNGRKRMEGHYQDGRPHGLWIWWHSNG